MTTNNEITVRMVIPDPMCDICTMVLERNGIATMHTFSMVRFYDDGEDSIASPKVNPIQEAFNDGLLKLLQTEKNPPPDIAIEDPKPAPAPKASAPKAATPKKQTPAKPAPPPVKAKWWTNEDTGAVKRDDGPTMDTDGWFGPFDTEAEAEANVPEWLKSAFKPKKKR